jgi:hypothetical protein
MKIFGKNILMKIKEILKDPMLVFIVLNLLDAVFTYIFMIGTHSSNELNPIYRGLFVLFGVGESLILLKMIGILCMAYIYYILIDNNKRPTLTRAFKYINIFYILIVLNNLYWIIRNLYIL